MKLKRPLRSSETGADVRMVQRALNRWSNQAVPIPTDGKYGQRTSDRMVAFQLSEKISPARGDFGQTTLDKLWPHFDRYGKWRYRIYRPPQPESLLPDIGPVVKGERSLLDLSLTHNSDGIALFPAVDVAWDNGIPLIAPENAVVDTKDTSANPGEALYLTGESKLRYWFAHLDRDHPLGKRFKKGEVLGRTFDQRGTDHGHIGVNGEVYLGKGRQFLYGRNGNGPDYTLGSPTIRRQLERVLL